MCGTSRDFQRFRLHVYEEYAEPFVNSDLFFVLRFHFGHVLFLIFIRFCRRLRAVGIANVSFHSFGQGVFLFSACAECLNMTPDVCLLSVPQVEQDLAMGAGGLFCF